jgi:hypothetical protein
LILEIENERGDERRRRIRNKISEIKSNRAREMKKVLQYINIRLKV